MLLTDHTMKKIVDELHTCLPLTIEESYWAISIVLRNLPVQNINGNTKVVGGGIEV